MTEENPGRIPSPPPAETFEKSVKDKVNDAKESLNTTEAPIHAFDPSLPPDQKAQAILNASNNEGLKAPVFSPRDELDKSNRMEPPAKTTDGAAAAQAAAAFREGGNTMKDTPPASSGSASSKPSHSSFQQAAHQVTSESNVVSALHQESAPADPATLAKEQETVQGIKTYIGWQEVGDEPKDFVEKHLSEAYYGKSIFNALSVLIVGFLSWFITRIGLGFGWCIILWSVVVVYHNTSVKRFKRAVKDDLVRELAVPRLEADTESVEWMNSFLSRFWLIYEPVLSATIVASVDSVLMDSTPSFLDSLRLTTFTLGSKAPRIEEIRTYPNTDQDIIMMDWRLSFVPAADEELTAKQKASKVNPKIVLTVRVGKGFVGAGIPILLEDIVFKGQMRIRIKLMNSFPHVQIVDLSFLEPPVIDYVLKPIGGETMGFDIAHIPGLAPYIRDTIHSNLAPMMYDPNVFTLDVAGMMNASGADADSACGVIKLTLQSASSLKHGDLLGTPDPYVRFRIGGRAELGRTETQENTVNPIWNETFFLLVKNLDEKMTLEIMDWNNMKKDSHMGNVEFDLAALQNEPELEDYSAPVYKEGKTDPLGSLKMTAIYSPVVPPIKEEDGTEKPVESNIGILRITLNQAKELDTSVSMVGQLSPYGLIRVNGKQVKKTRILKRHNTPVWEESIEVFVSDLKSTRVALDLKDDRDLAQDPLLGSWRYKATEVIARSSKAQDWYSLAETRKGGKVRVNAVWRPILMDAAHAGTLSPVVGVVRLHLIEGVRLHNTETTGTADPYIRVMVGSQMRGKTRVIDADLNPKWDEVLYLPVHGHSEAFVLQAMDWNSHIKDKIIGDSVLQVASLVEKVTEDVADSAKLTETPEGEEAEVKVPEGTNEVGKKVVRYISKGITDLWSPLTLQGGKNRGNLHYTAQFFPLEDLPEEVKIDKEDNSKNATTTVTDNGSPSQPEPSTSVDWASYPSGVLQMTIHEARGFRKPFKAFTEVLVNRNDNAPAHRTKVLKKTVRPRWDEACEVFIKETDVGLVTFLIRHGGGSDEADLRDTDTSPILGRCELRVIDLLRQMNAKKLANATSTSEEQEEEADNTMDQGAWFPFDVSSAKGSANPATTLTTTTTDNSLGGAAEGSTAEIRCSFKFSPVAVKIDFSESYLDQGTLDFEVVSGKDLPAVDSSGTSDPYVIVTLEEEKVFKTKTIKKNLNPTFKEAGPTLSIISRTRAHFELDVYDWNKVEKNERLGKGLVDLVSLEPMQSQTVDVALGPRGGIITLRCTFRPAFLSGLGPKSTTILQSFGTTALNVVNPINGAKQIGGVGKTVVGGVAGGVMGGVRGVTGIFGRKKGHDKHEAAAEETPSPTPAIQVHGSNVVSEADTQTRSIESNPANMGAVTASGQVIGEDTAVNTAGNGLDHSVHDTSTPSSTLTSRSGSGGAAIMGHQSNMSIDSMIPPSEVPGSGNAAGFLTLHILGAKDLLAADRGGTSDPYIKVIMQSPGGNGKGHTVHKTRVIKKTLEPEWSNETVTVPINAETPVIRLSVKDHNTLGGDKDIGDYDLRVVEELGLNEQAVMGPVNKELWTSPGALASGGRGQLHLRLEWAHESVHPSGGGDDGKRRSGGGLFGGLKKKTSGTSG